MGSVTSWSRLEPQSADPTLRSLSARTADPLWLLARQWQLGELSGEDAGSAVEVRLRYAACPITRYRAGPLPAGGAGNHPDVRPWEALVEAEAESAPQDRRVAALAGQRFLDALGPVLSARYGDAVRGQYSAAPLSDAEAAAADERTRRLARLLAGRAVDGLALHDALAASVPAGGLPAALKIAVADEAAVLAAAEHWLSWWDERFAGGADAWQADRLGYAFAIAAPAPSGEVVLAARDHRGGPIDWATFDVAVGASLGAAGDAAVTETEVSALPTGVGFPGMPAPRWWQFESGKVDLGRLEAAPDDLGRLLLAEFALVYGNDFFCVPLRLPVGTACRVTGLDVTTTFGETVAVPSAAAADGATGPRWRMYQLATGIPDDDGGMGWLLVPSSAVGLQESEAVEDVLFSRDEMTDVAWAVERRVTGPAGAVMERREAFHRAASPRVPPSGHAALLYELATAVPPHWLPLVPVSAGPGRVRLELRGPHQPLGRLLGGGTSSAPFAVAAEELPRDGRWATRHHRRTRGVDGSTVVWIARRVRVGRGESSAGLRFDQLVSE
jgi:hypothetical protein